jgi:dephospho-CoA kinase
MLRVALTGGIGSGKSVIADVFRRRGCYLYIADFAAHNLMTPEERAYPPIVERFGGTILAPDRTIDRAALSAILFNDPEARRFVNGVVHPLVIAEMRAVAARLEHEGRTRIFVSESALTIEAGLADEFDRIVVVRCDPETQIARLMARDGLTRSAALARIGAQMPVEEKIKYADFVIDTSGPLEETLARAEAVCSLLFDEAGATGGRPP